MYIFIIIFVFTSLSLQIFIDYENQNCKLLIKEWPINYCNEENN